jgi:hypothetical protein
MNIIDAINNTWRNLFPQKNISPAHFRRGARKFKGNIIGLSIDRNSRNAGNFQGGIAPMRRRFKGVSRTARKS